MNRYLELVNEWQTTIGSPGIDITEDTSVETRKMRLKLIFEELSELADAYGLSEFFKATCFLAAEDRVEGYVCLGNEDDIRICFDRKEDSNVLNKVEALDALADLQYVLSGSVIETGMTEVFDDAMEEVHDSNMSKFPETQPEADETVNNYKTKGIDSKIEVINYRYVIKREDGKVLKSINYLPADFQQFIP